MLSDRCSDSEGEDGGYLRRALPEKKPMVGLKSPIVIGDLQSNGVDFEIEDVLNEQSRELHKDELNELHDNDEYISDICSRFNPLSMSSGLNDEDEEDFVALKKCMQDVTHKFSSQHRNMIFKRVLEESHLKGSSADADVASNGLVSIEYSAYLEGQDEPFDSTRKRRHAHTFRIGDKSTIEGIELGVMTMKVGERSQFLVSPELAYGKFGLPSVVPANSEVLFDILLQDCVRGDASEQLERESRHNESGEQEGDERPALQLRLKASKEEFKMGNRRYAVKNYREALRHYRKASDMVSWESVRDDEEDRERMALWAKIERGVCRCLFQLAKYGPCLSQCKPVLDFYPDDPVINLLKGKCLLVLSERRSVDGAIRAFQKGLRGSPGSSALSQALNDAIKEKNDELEKANSNYSAEIKQGLQKFCGVHPATSEQTTQSQTKSRKCNASKFASRPKPEFKARIHKHIAEILEGKKASHSFHTMNLTSLEFEYIQCAAEDENLTSEERGVGCDGVLTVFK
ncbi:uncharacterized protein LOC142341164 [Convolutriloba macropyga]|uniref:uncharacterized protein LOC142341164 n=1 Tax=Convolutriloba macropyga TaxID=536237 RepID=UPI003F527186